MICQYCGKRLTANTGYCCKRHAELDRGFLPEAGVGGSRQPNQTRTIRAALKLWDAHKRKGRHNEHCSPR